MVSVDFFKKGSRMSIYLIPGLLICINNHVICINIKIGIYIVLESCVVFKFNCFYELPVLDPAVATL